MLPTLTTARYQLKLRRVGRSVPQTLDLPVHATQEQAIENARIFIQQFNYLLRDVTAVEVYHYPSDTTIRTFSF